MLSQCLLTGREFSSRSEAEPGEWQGRVTSALHFCNKGAETGLPDLLKAHVTMAGARSPLWSSSQEGGTDQCRDEVEGEAQARSAGEPWRGKETPGGWAVQGRLPWHLD